MSSITMTEPEIDAELARLGISITRDPLLLKMALLDQRKAALRGEYHQELLGCYMSVVGAFIEIVTVAQKKIKTVDEKWEKYLQDSKTS